MYERTQNWRAVIKKVDPAAEQRISEFISYTIARQSAVPRKYKEMFLMACAASLRYGISTRVHGIEAMRNGATKEELIEVLSIVSIQAGFTAFVDAIEALGDQLDPDKNGSER